MFHSHSRAFRRRLAGIVIALVAPALGACSGPAASPSLLPAPAVSRQAGGIRPDVPDAAYTFKILAAPQGTKHTLLLGINDLGKITGFYGNGLAKDPAVGFSLYPPYGSKNFIKTDYPEAVDTEVTAVNNSRVIVGWYLDKHGNIYGFSDWLGIFSSYKDIHLRFSKTEYTKLLGINDSGQAVGYYENTAGKQYAFELNMSNDTFPAINPPGAVDAVATGINDKGDVVGYYQNAAGAIGGWLLKGGRFTEFAYPSARGTYPLALNWQDQIVGYFVGKIGKSAGFILNDPLTSQDWESVHAPNSNGATAITSINDHQNMVGYFVNREGHTQGFLGTRRPP